LKSKETEPIPVQLGEALGSAERSGGTIPHRASANERTTTMSAAELTRQHPKQEQGEVTTVERTRGGLSYSPRIDIWETDDELVLYADMPGVAPENLDIQFENRELRIHGKVSPRHEGVQFLYGEYGIGDFYRTFTIGEMIAADKISAQLRDGVLLLHLPKTEAVKPRRIAVRAS
jgi:HSP20 family molecular chaperone IbpA